METHVTRYFVRKRQRMQIDGKVQWLDVGTEVAARWLPTSAVARMIRMGFIEERKEIIVLQEAPLLPVDPAPADAKKEPTEKPVEKPPAKPKAP